MGSAGRRIRTHPERTFAAGRAPTFAFHDHPHDHADRLPQTGAAVGVQAVEKGIDGGNRFELQDDASEGGPIVVQLGFFHPPLAMNIVEKIEDRGERLFGIVDDVGVGFALRAGKKLFAGEEDAGDVRIRLNRHDSPMWIARKGPDLQRLYVTGAGRTSGYSSSGWNSRQTRPEKRLAEALEGG